MFKKLLINFIKNILHRFDFDIVKNEIIDFNENFNSSNLKLLKTNIIVNYKLNDLITTAGQRLGSTDDPYFYALKYIILNIEILIRFCFVNESKSKGIVSL